MEKRVSEDALDYAQFIIHYKRNHAASDRVVEMCSAYNSECLLQDVDQISREARPPWLNGVPIVISLPDYVVHRGSAAIEVVQMWCEAQVGGVGSSKIGIAASVPSAQLDTANAKAMPLLAEDARYSDGRTKKRSQEADLGQPSSLEELMRLRASRSAPPS